MIIERTINKIQIWLRNRESIRELSAMSNRDLARIGLLRSDIEAVVKHSH